MKKIETIVEVVRGRVYRDVKAALIGEVGQIVGKPLLMRWRQINTKGCGSQINT